MGDLTTHFSRKEFECQCGCGYADISMDLVARLECVRVLFGKAIHITSGCRCPGHNEHVGGVADSAHLEGLAADITCQNARDRFWLIQCLFGARITRIGIGQEFIHIDIDPDKVAEVMWLYKGE